MMDAVEGSRPESGSAGQGIEWENCTLAQPLHGHLQAVLFCPCPFFGLDPDTNVCHAHSGCRNFHWSSVFRRRGGHQPELRRSSRQVERWGVPGQFTLSYGAASWRVTRKRESINLKMLVVRRCEVIRR